MENVEDEFDELYADVEVQASTAINSNHGEPGNVEGEGEVDEESDSEDDLKILLNDEDASGKQEDGCGDRDKSHYKYARPHLAPFSNYTRANVSGMVVYRVGWDDGECFQNRFSNPSVAQGGHMFSLPRHRTILDVNVDAFEQKLWRTPGVDASEFFNFGFDEESWKKYCNGLEYHARAGNEWKGYEAMVGMSARVGQTCSLPLSSEKTHKEQQQLEMLTDGKIQVEDSFTERNPSMDLKDFLERDSDVIEIVPQDQNFMVNDSIGSGTDEPICNNSSDHEASEEVDIVANDEEEMFHSHDELFVDLEEDSEGSLRTCPQRSPRLTASPDTVSKDLDYHLNNQAYDRPNDQMGTGSRSTGSSDKNRNSFFLGSQYERYGINGASTHQGRSYTHLGRNSDSLSDLELVKYCDREEYVRKGRSPYRKERKPYKGYEFSPSPNMRDRRGTPEFDWGSYDKNLELGLVEKKGGCYYDEKKRYYERDHKVSSFNNHRRDNSRLTHIHFADKKTSRGGDEGIQEKWQRYGMGRYFGKSWSFSNRERRSPERRGDEIQIDKRMERDNFMLNSKQEFYLKRKHYGIYSSERNSSDNVDDARTFPREYDFDRSSFRCFENNHNRYMGKGQRNMYDEKGGHSNGRYVRYMSRDKDRDRYRDRGSSWSDDDGYFHDGRGITNYPRQQLNSGGRHLQSESLNWAEDKYTSRPGERKFSDKETRFNNEQNYPCQQLHSDRRHWQSESLNWAEDEYTFRPRDRDLFDEETRFGNEQKVVSDWELEQRKRNLIWEGYSRNYIKRSNVFERGDSNNTYLSDEEFDDLHLVAEEEKFSKADRRIVYTNKPEDAYIDDATQEEYRNYDISPDKAGWIDKFPVAKLSDFETEKERILRGVNEDPVDDNFDDDVATGRSIVDDVDSSLILKAVAKMEQRRERFKEPTASKGKTEMISNETEVVTIVETVKNIHGRPTRKRRWGGT